MAIYLDCASTTPLDHRVRDEVMRALADDYGNTGSRTHEYGRRARSAVERARDRVASVVGASRGDVVFTSGATESNNLAILGLAHHGEASRRKHIVSSAIEHHAVLEPLKELARRGFDVTHIQPDDGGRVDADAVLEAVRRDTLLVSIMHVNNETGIIQPIDQIASRLQDDAVMLHVDAAQGFGRDIHALRHSRIDLISLSGHKIHAPQGVGALVTRRRNGLRPPLTPLMYGGGQERGRRPGTLPVHLIVGLGKASELALGESASRAEVCLEFRRKLLDGLAPLGVVINGNASLSVPHIVNFSIPGVNAEVAIEAWRNIVAVSHGAACTSQTYTCSHVLKAMNVPVWRQDGALRLSWCHFTQLPDTGEMVAAINRVNEPVRGAAR